MLVLTDPTRSSGKVPLKEDTTVSPHILYKPSYHSTMHNRIRWKSVVKYRKPRNLSMPCPWYLVQEHYQLQTRPAISHLAVINSMELSTSPEVANCAANQEFPNILRNPKVHYRIHKNCSLSWAKSIQSIWPHPKPTRPILILSSRLSLGLPSCLFPSDFPTKILYAFLLYPMRDTWPAHPILLHWSF
jgi:hypothetical protein